MALLGFAGYTACSSTDMYGCPTNDQPFPAPEYGCPYAEYIFNAEVKDGETDTPIEGIRVSAVQRYLTNELDNIDTLATGLTSADGKVRLQYGCFPTDQHELVADDIDGAKNGEYNSISTTVTTNSDDYTGGGGAWDEGTVTHNVTISLTKK